MKARTPNVPPAGAVMRTKPVEDGDWGMVLLDGKRAYYDDESGEDENDAIVYPSEGMVYEDDETGVKMNSYTVVPLASLVRPVTQTGELANAELRIVAFGLRLAATAYAQLGKLKDAQDATALAELVPNIWSWDTIDYDMGDEDHSAEHSLLNDLSIPEKNDED